MPAIAAVGSMCLILLGFMFYMYTGEVERRVTAEVASQTAQLSLDYKDATAKLSQELSDLQAAHAVEIVTARGAYTQEINSMRSTYEQDLRNEPFNTGDFYERRLATLMCKIAASSDEDIRTCNLQGSRPYSPDTSIVVTVTADTAEQWSEQCEAGLADYCNYAMVSFTTQGALTFIDYFNQVQSHIQELRNARDYDGKIIDALVEGFDKNEN